MAKAKRLATYNNASVNFSVATIFVQFADPQLRAGLCVHRVRSLKPGGSLILVGYTPKQLEYRTAGPSVLSHLYTPNLLREALGDLDIPALDVYETELSEGDGHRGRSAVIGWLPSDGSPDLQSARKGAEGSVVQPRNLAQLPALYTRV